MPTSTEICNIALSHLGSGKEISDLETERSAEASACRRFYDTALEATLRDFPWPFATTITTLGLIEEDPNDEWAFSYRYPTDCLKIRRLLSGVRNDTRQSRMPYKIGQDGSGRVVWTDLEDAQVEYTIRAEDTTLYTPDFVLAFSFRIAAYIAPRVTGGDPFKMGDRALQMYRLELGNAEPSAVGEEQAEEEVESEFIRGRE